MKMPASIIARMMKTDAAGENFCSRRPHVHMMCPLYVKLLQLHSDMSSWLICGRNNFASQWTLHDPGNENVPLCTLPNRRPSPPPPPPPPPPPV
jgi:hypothetical protein